jgi:hypothetical protein
LEQKEKYPHLSPSQLIVSFDLANGPWNFVPGDFFSLYPVSNYLDPAGPRAEALGIGQSRFRSMIQDFEANSDVRIVEGIFGLGDEFLWVVTRIRVSVADDGTEKATVLNGISYMGLDYNCPAGRNVRKPAP